MNRHHAVATSGVLLGLSVATVEFYSVRELVAALLIFSILFTVMGAAVLMVIVTEELALKGMARIETRFAYVRVRIATSLHAHRDPVVRSPLRR